MFLLTNERVREYMKKNELIIDPFDPEGLETACYRFRIGRYVAYPNDAGDSQEVKDISKPGHASFSIQPKSFVVVQSLETFRFSQRIMGMFSMSSSLFLRGFRLSNSLAVDPGFGGVLEVAIENFNRAGATLNYMDRIGKLLLFDVSDSKHPGMSPAELARPEIGRRERGDPPMLGPHRT